MKQYKLNYAAISPEALASRVTIREAAEIIGVSVNTIHRMIKDGRLSVFNSYNVQFISLNSLNKIMKTD